MIHQKFIHNHKKIPGKFSIVNDLELSSHSFRQNKVENLESDDQAAFQYIAANFTASHQLMRTKTCDMDQDEQFDKGNFEVPTKLTVLEK